MPKIINKTVVVALSGGVDSSVAAALLKEQGYKVVGVHIKIWSDPEIPCTLKQDRYDAMRVAAKLNIPFKTWDFTKQYGQQVVDYMINEYRVGRTPNPDVMCNKRIKFDVFLKKARELKADFIATGHHARITRATLNRKPYTVNYKLLAGKDKNKDQSYFLWTLTQEQLKYILFPIGDYTKPQVRKIAKKLNLPTAGKKDSQGICFIGEINLREFLKKYIKEKPGPVVTIKGQKIGEHDGLFFYTIGQRHGMGIGGGTPYYVAEKDFKTNTLVVTESPKHKALYSKELVANKLNWIVGAPPKFPLMCKARIRYRQPLQSCRVFGHSVSKSEKLQIIFTKPQKAIAPGQFLVFYHGDELLGGGIIS